MGTQGVPFKPEKKDIIDAIIKHYGIIAAVAAQFKVTRQTMYDYIEDHPDLNEILNKSRNSIHGVYTELARNGAMKTLKGDNPRLVWEASKYFLEKEAAMQGDPRSEKQAAIEDSITILRKDI